MFRPDTTEKLLTGTLSLNTTKSSYLFHWFYQEERMKERVEEEKRMAEQRKEEEIRRKAEEVKIYGKNPKNSHTQKISCNHSKI